MHIPDGFMSQQTFLPAYLVTIGLWWVALNRVKQSLDAQTLPLIAVTAALSFVLMMIAIPLPGGTSVHALGVAMITSVFGLWIGFLSISLVLLMQALLFGDGGITSLSINVLGIAFIGSFSAYITLHLLRGWHETLALFMAGFLSVMLSALFIATLLGIQPLIATDAQGNPLFFPFALEITLPAILIPHFFLAIAEGVLTVLAYRFFTQFKAKLEA